MINEHEIELYKSVIFNYVVLFKSDHKEEKIYTPIIQMSDVDIEMNEDTMHLWDNDLNSIIPAIWYVMHLPRNAFDTISCDIDLILHSYDEPHNIIPIPYSTDIRGQLEYLINFIIKPTVIICEDEIYHDIKEQFKALNCILGIVRTSELNSLLLHKHWNELSIKFHEANKDTEMCIIDKTFRLTSAAERKIIPLIPLANQFGYTKQLISEIKELTIDNNYNKYALAMHYRVLKLCKILSEKSEEFSESIIKVIDESPLFNKIPLVITFPGTMRSQKNKYKRAESLPDCEKEIIEILGIHRATAKKAVYLELGNVPNDMFVQLAKLEEHCKTAKKINNFFIWKVLKEIGKELTVALGDNSFDIIEQISQITVFSDFPIGLAILPKCSAPLCCIKPISYRPLTPLTRAFQCEMTKINQVYLGKKMKVIIAECIEKNDRIRKICDGLTETIKKISHKEKNIDVVTYDVTSVPEFKDMLNKNPDADILLISAHGTYDIDSNMAGLVVGKEMWMMNDNDIHLPPVVLLSACHVMPRGHGVVAVGDLALRAGAIAVLGTFIPVDVNRNATLIVRLFTEIIEVRKGWSNMRTLDEIWCHIVCTNPIHEIISSMTGGVSKLELWANTRRNDGSLPQEDFKMKDSVGRLRCTHAYEDTVNILREIAYRDGIGEYYDSYINSQGYFPESVFYQLVGRPENIFFRNDVFEKVDE